MAIGDRCNSSSMVTDIQNALLLAKRNGTEILIEWVKAHVGNEGNERADTLAKSGAQEQLAQMDVKAPISFVKRTLTNKAREEWNTNWMEETRGRWTANFFPTLKHRRDCKILEPDFVTTQFITGHGKFGKYLHDRRLVDDPACKCGAVQNCEHLIFECPLLFNERSELVAQVATERFSFEERSLHKIITKPSTHEELIRLFKRIHRNLVRWEQAPP